MTSISGFDQPPGYAIWHGSMSHKSLPEILGSQTDTGMTKGRLAGE